MDFPTPPFWFAIAMIRELRVLVAVELFEAAVSGDAEEAVEAGARSLTAAS